MGYTHYFSHESGPTPNEWAALCEAALLILAEARCPIQYEYDDSRPPVVSPRWVRFNGVGEDGHETFVLRNAPLDFDFCTTAAKSYDAVVCAVLLVASELGWSVSSDGTWAEWREGRDLFERALGRAPSQPIDLR
ncbi:MAG: hypothetical protein GY871_04080 [Actinomycetales bacterium]|nr:hypothetical protein [Actinomycetales bacterium]